MSLDASYILSYDNLPYCKPTPMQKDMEYLEKKFGGSFTIFDHGNSIFWQKPKYTLLREECDKLMADQILQKKDFEFWEIIKPVKEKIHTMTIDELPTWGHPCVHGKPYPCDLCKVDNNPEKVAKEDKNG